MNDFNLFGRTYKVMLQAEQDFRKIAGEHQRHLRALQRRRHGADVHRQHDQHDDRARTSCSATTCSARRRSTAPTGPAYPPDRPSQSWRTLAAKELPQGYGFEWTSIAFQEKEAGGTQGPIFGMAMIFVFLVLAAQYESWAVPFSVLLGLPIGVFGAFLGVSLVGLENNVYVQIGIVDADGPGRQERHPHRGVRQGVSREEGHGPLVDAAIEGARLRFRPIMMTALAFILGVVPLVMASGAGAAARVSIGIAVFAGMLMASTVGLFFIPMLYVLIQSGAYLVTGNRQAIKGRRPAAQPCPGKEDIMNALQSTHRLCWPLV